MLDSGKKPRYDGSQGCGAWVAVQTVPGDNMSEPATPIASPTALRIRDLKLRAAKAATKIPAFARTVPGVQDALSITTDLLRVVETLEERISRLEGDQ